MSEARAEAAAALAPTGRLRVALYAGSPTSLVRDAATGEARGVGLDLGHAMAAGLGVPFELAEFPDNAQVLDAVKHARADFAFTNATAARMKDLDFSPALVGVEQGFLVPAGAALAAADDVDRAGVRVGVTRASTSERELAAQLRHATLVPVASVREGRERMAAGGLDAFATNKVILGEMARALPGSRILAGRYGLETLAIGVPKGREAGHAWLGRFAAAARDDGTVRRAAERAGLHGLITPP